MEWICIRRFRLKAGLRTYFLRILHVGLRRPETMKPALRRERNRPDHIRNGRIVARGRGAARLLSVGAQSGEGRSADRASTRLI